jgi:hypothetical protein
MRGLVVRELGMVFFAADFNDGSAVRPMAMTVLVAVAMIMGVHVRGRRCARTWCIGFILVAAYQPDEAHRHQAKCGRKRQCWHGKTPKRICEQDLTYLYSLVRINGLNDPSVSAISALMHFLRAIMPFLAEFPASE